TLVGEQQILHYGDELETLIGGSSNDFFRFEDAAKLAFGDGTINGGGGFNTVDYQQYTTAVMVDLIGGTGTGVSQLLNIQNALLPQNDLVVTNTNDSGPGSLRQAMLDA